MKKSKMFKIEGSCSETLNRNLKKFLKYLSDCNSVHDIEIIKQVICWNGSTIAVSFIENNAKYDVNIRFKFSGDYLFLSDF